MIQSSEPIKAWSFSRRMNFGGVPSTSFQMQRLMELICGWWAHRAIVAWGRTRPTRFPIKKGYGSWWCKRARPVKVILFCWYRCAMDLITAYATSTYLKEKVVRLSRPKCVSCGQSYRKLAFADAPLLASMACSTSCLHGDDMVPQFSSYCRVKFCMLGGSSQLVSGWPKLISPGSLD